MYCFSGTFFLRNTNCQPIKWRKCWSHSKLTAVLHEHPLPRFFGSVGVIAPKCELALYLLTNRTEGSEPTNRCEVTHAVWPISYVAIHVLRLQIYFCVQLNELLEENLNSGKITNTCDSFSNQLFTAASLILLSAL